MKNPLYKDRFAPDGYIACGWRYVRKGGWIKAVGSWWHAKGLEPLTGELVHFQVEDYWATRLIISRGGYDCYKLFCYTDEAKREREK